MSKSFLSIIVPVQKSILEHTILELLAADRNLEKALFDYEIIIVGHKEDPARTALQQLARTLANTKYCAADNDTLGAMLACGLRNSSGTWKAFGLLNCLSFSAHFEKMFPLLKNHNALVGPAVNARMLAAIFIPPYQFQIINEEVITTLPTSFEELGLGAWTELFYLAKASGHTIGAIYDAPRPFWALPLYDLRALKETSIIRLRYIKSHYALPLFNQRPFRGITRGVKTP